MIQVSNKRGNWTDNPCYYVDVKNDSQTGILAGPFRTQEEAEKQTDKCQEIAIQIDAMAHFYAFGTCRLVNGYREGLFNSRLGL